MMIISSYSASVWDDCERLSFREGWYFSEKIAPVLEASDKHMIQKDNSAYRFGPFALLPSERQLLRDAVPVSLTPKSFELLERLVREAGRVVSKETLMAELWPGRFVLESNLTKHIWAVRKALEVEGQATSYIETVSKIGYRFKEPVSRVDAGPLAIDPQPVKVLPVRPQRIAGWRDIRTIAVATLFIAIAGMAVWWFGPGQERGLPWAKPSSPKSMAIFEFDNLSRDGRNAWIGPAFADMLRTDAAQGGQLYLLPEELVHAASRDAPKAAAFSPDTLEKMRRRLSVDYVVTGAFLTSGADGAPIRFDIAVQDAGTGATIAAFSRNGVSNGLPALVASAGAELRKDLGIPSHSKSDLARVAKAQPPTLDVSKRVGFAIAALHRYDAAQARDQLLQAIVEAPGYAPAYVYLAKAWSALGYKQKAAATAKQAADRSEGLPNYMRLQIEALSAETQYHWPRAIEALHALVALQPDNSEPQLELAATLLAAGQPKNAQSAVDRLRNVGSSVADDPRLEILSARIANAQDDEIAAKAHAEKALTLAQGRGDTPLVAEAATQLGAILTASDPKAALAMLKRALDAYRRSGNPSGEAAVHRDIGNVFTYTQAARAREEYQASLEQYRAIEDRNGMAAAYADIGITLWSAGDRDGAETAVRNVLALRRETDDKAGEAWALTALAIEQSDDRASDEAVANFRQAAAIDASIGAHSHRGFTLYSLSDVLRLRGAFAQAKAVCVEAQIEYAQVRDLVNQANADFQCAQIMLDHGEVQAARALLGRVLGASQARKDLMTQGNVLLTQGQIALGEARWSRAIDLLGQAITVFKSGSMPTGEAVATSLRALGYAATNDVHRRGADIARARNLREGMTERLELYGVDVALAELGSDMRRLDDIAADARARHWPGWALEAELAELRVLQEQKSAAAAAALRKRIALEARNGGFGWVLARLP